MPLEIKELHIRVSVNDGEQTQSGGGATQAENKEAIIQICVDRVLDILKRKMER